MYSCIGNAGVDVSYKSQGLTGVKSTVCKQGEVTVNNFSSKLKGIEQHI